VAASLALPSRRGAHRLAEEHWEEYVSPPASALRARTASETYTDTLTSSWTGSMGTARSRRTSGGGSGPYGG